MRWNGNLFKGAFDCGTFSIHRESFVVLIGIPNDVKTKLIFITPPPPQVNKYWNLLALDGSNWQKIDLFDFQRDIEGPVIENISHRCGGFLKSLSLNGCQAVGDLAILTLAQYCPNIEHIDLTKGKKISDLAVQSLSNHCPKLSAIILDNCVHITDQSLKALADGCPVSIGLGDEVSIGF